MQRCTGCVLLAIFLLISVLNASKAKVSELDLTIESRFKQYGYPVGILRNPAVSPELCTMILEKLTILQYADYLSYEPRTAEFYCLPNKKELALLSWAYWRIQELRGDNEDERVIIKRIKHAVSVIVRKRNLSLVNYEQASLEERPGIAAQGMEHAVRDLREISTRPFWVRLGIKAFIKFDDFPTIHKFLSQQFLEAHGHCMLRAAALAGKMEVFEYLAAFQRTWTSDQLQKLMKYACHGGHVGLFEWVSLKLSMITNKTVRKAFSWVVEAEQAKFLEHLMRKYPGLSRAMLVQSALLAIEKGSLATLNVLVNCLGGSRAIVSHKHFGGAFCKAAANGNAKTLQYLFELGEDMVLGHSDLKKALEMAVEFGHLTVLEYLFEDSNHVDGLHGEFPELFAELYLRAAWKGHLHILRFLLSENGDSSPRFPQIDPACRARHPAIVGSQFPRVVSEFPTFDALGLAARAGHEKIVEYLLMLKRTGKERFEQIDPTAKGHFALSQAILCRHQRIVDRLFQFVDSNACTSSVAVACGCSGNVKMIKAVTEMKLLGNESSGLARTMTLACSYGHLEILEHILNNQLKYTAQPFAGEMRDCLSQAVNNGHVRIVRYILQKIDGNFLFGPIDMATYGPDLLVLAVINRNVSMIELLLKIAREENINRRGLRNIRPSLYLDHYPTAQIISKEIHGSCPFPVDSILEMVWIIWNVARQKQLFRSALCLWRNSPRKVDGRWTLVRKLALPANIFMWTLWPLASWALWSFEVFLLELLPNAPELNLFALILFLTQMISFILLTPFIIISII